MVSIDDCIPRTPQVIRSSVSIEDIDYERRLRRERLVKQTNTFGTPRSFELKRANPTPILMEDDGIRGTKRRCVHTSCDNKENSNHSYIPHPIFRLPMKTANSLPPFLITPTPCSLRPRSLRVDLEASAGQDSLQNSSDLMLPFMPL
jgi:hypothetical protein